MFQFYFQLNFLLIPTTYNYIYEYVYIFCQHCFKRRMNKTYWIRCEDTQRDFTSKYHFNIVCISVKRPYGFCLTLYTILSFILSSEMDGGHMIIDSMILKKYIKLSIIRISKIDVRGHNCFLQLSEINSYDSINL